MDGELVRCAPREMNTGGSCSTTSHETVVAPVWRNTEIVPPSSESILEPLRPSVARSPTFEGRRSPEGARSAGATRALELAPAPPASDRRAPTPRAGVGTQL